MTHGEVSDTYFTEMIKLDQQSEYVEGVYFGLTKGGTYTITTDGLNCNALIVPKLQTVA